MAYQQDGAFIAHSADADLSASEGCAVKRTATGVDLCGANSTTFLGVLTNDPKITEFATVRRYGTAKAKAGAAFAVDAKLTTDSTGRFVTATAGQNVWGKALEAAGAANQFVAVEVLRYGGTA